MGYWQYQRILHAVIEWEEARRVLPPIRDKEKPKLEPLPIRADGTGPQVVP